MKVLLISTGIGSWPNTGWGACENIVADFAWALEKEGADVKVLHTASLDKELVPLVEEWKPDVVHCEYDDHIIQLRPILEKMPNIRCVLTTHYAYLSQPYRLIQDGYMWRFLLTSNLARLANLTLAVLSEEIAATYQVFGSVPSEKLWVFPNGTRTDCILCNDEPKYPDRAVCLGKIESRKNQQHLQKCKQIDFVGPIATNEFQVGPIATNEFQFDDSYKGQWTREELYTNLTQYSCLVLYSKAEAHPLVIGEALAAGCSILCSSVAAANLPRDKPWIRILSNLENLDRHVKEMCELGVQHRQEITLWAQLNLDWRLRARTYLEKWSTDRLRIALIGPGIMPIPPTGWGAVEQLIWDYSLLLKKKGHHVDIINTPNRQEIICRVNEGSYDVAHLHYDVFWDILKDLRTKKVCVTSAYPYVDVPDRWDRDGYRQVFHGICSAIRDHGVHCYAMSVKDANTFLTLGNLNHIHHRVYLMPNGVNTESFRFTETPAMGDRSVVLAKIEPRKRQHLTYWLPNVDYIGRGPFNHPNYRGELQPREQLLNILCEYGNFILLSDGENGTPLVVKEAMAAGLGVVLSESAANELPRNLPWITVIPESDLANTSAIAMAIQQNLVSSRPRRKEIREWIYKNWDWNKLVDQYVSNLKSC